MLEPKTITQHLLEGRHRPAKWIAIRFKRHKKWLELNWSDYYRSCEACGLGLAALGVSQGDRVAVLANTRWEWGALDFGIMGLGAVTVPIYQSNRAEEIEFVINHAEPRVLVVEDQSQLRKWEQISRRCKSVEHVVCINSYTDMPTTVLGWDDFLDQGFAGLQINLSFSL